MLDFLGDLRRTHMCGALRSSDAGKKAVLMGWVNKRRDHGSLLFIDLRDRTGITQVVFNADRDAAIHEKAGTLRNEYVIAVIGTVKLRDANTINPNMPTGEVELVAEELRILNESKLPPFLPSDTALTNEETRLKYRYIDLRRDVMQFNIETAAQGREGHPRLSFGAGILRNRNSLHDALHARRRARLSCPQPRAAWNVLRAAAIAADVQADPHDLRLRQIFSDRPLLPRRRPARRPPARVHPDRSGDVLSAAGTRLGGSRRISHRRLPRRRTTKSKLRSRAWITTKPSASTASTSPILRLPAFTDVRECFTPENLQELAINANLPLIAIRTPKVGELSRKERDDIKPMFHSKGGAKIFEDFKRIGNKFPEAAAAIEKKCAAQERDLIVLVAGSAQSGPQTAMPAHRKVTPAELAIYASAGLLRLALAQKYADRHGIFKKTGDPANDFRFLWVTNFPMFEWDESEKQWMAAHHPFTSPHEEDMKLLEAGVESVNDPQSPLSAVRALAYDVVLNGTELGSGSIRIHRQDIQSKIFRALGMTEEEAKRTLRILPRSPGVRHSATWRHRPWPRPHRHDHCRSRKPARSNSLPENRPRRGFDGGRTNASQRRAVARFGNCDKNEKLKSIQEFPASLRKRFWVPPRFERCDSPTPRRAASAAKVPQGLKPKTITRSLPQRWKRCATQKKA